MKRQVQGAGGPGESGGLRWGMGEWAPSGLPLIVLVMTWGCGLARAQDAAPAEPEPGPLQSEQSEPWFDTAHDTLERRLAEPLQWFDNFFADERAVAERPAGLFVRWRNDFTFTRDDDFEFDSDVDADFTLPRATKKLHLLVQSDVTDRVEQYLPSSDRTQSAPTAQDTAGAQLGVRYNIREAPRSKLSASFRVRPDFPPRYKARVRYRYIHPLTDVSVWTATQVVEWESEDGWGETTELDYEYRFSPVRALRLSGMGRFAELSNGYEWSSGLSLFRQLSERRALSYGFSVAGHTRPENFVDEYSVGINYRQSIFRSWIYFDINPFLSWPRGVDDPRHFNPGVIFRLEVQFDSLR